MKIKTSELSGTALDWAVAISKGIPAEELRLPDIKGWPLFRYRRDDEGELSGYVTGPDLMFSSKWEAGGPILEKIQGLQVKVWLEHNYRPDLKCEVHIHNYEGDWIAFGPTLLITGMRCYVASKLGDEVDVPEELL